ncbi:MAG TPA: YiiX family permuted papain-like enzyme [Thermoanaerobaculia bacterium]|nr:YiiX family permuted papain-like enzyme [Thermoanaerobaculia bacterium]
MLTLILLSILGKPALHDGDIIFHQSRSAQSAAIQHATKSHYSHMGVVRHLKGRWFVYEAAGPVKYTPLHEWIARGTGGHYVVKRLRNAQNIDRLWTIADRYRGKPYDFYFGWSDDRIYCSELVWKLYKSALGIEIGHLRRLRSFDLSDPIVQKKLRERYGEHVPLDEPVISPADMFDSALLIPVVNE